MYKKEKREKKGVEYIVKDRVGKNKNMFSVQYVCNRHCVSAEYKCSYSTYCTVFDELEFQCIVCTSRS